MKKLALTLLLLLGVSNIGLCSTFFVNQSLINIYLWAKFPIQKRILLNEITLSNPEVDLQEKNQLVTTKINFNINNNQKNIEGSIETQSSIIYENKSRFLILKSPAIQKISLNDGKEPPKNLMLSLNFLVSNILENFPIYKIDEELPLTGSSLNEIKIKNKGVEINYQ